MRVLCERVCHNKWKTGRGLEIDLSIKLTTRAEKNSRTITYLNAISSNFNLTPGDSLIRSSSSIAAIEFLSGVDIHGGLGTISHETCVGDMVLDNPATENDHPRPLGSNGERVDTADVLYQVDLQLLWRSLEGVEVEHIAQAPIRDGGAEDWDVVLVRPVIDGAFIVDLLPEAVDHLGGRPVNLVVGTLAGFLLLEHLIQDGHNPILEGAVVGIGDDEVADTVETLLAEGSTISAEGAHIGVS